MSALVQVPGVGRQPLKSKAARKSGQFALAARQAPVVGLSFGGAVKHTRRSVLIILVDSLPERAPFERHPDTPRVDGDDQNDTGDSEHMALPVETCVHGLSSVALYRG